MLRTVIKLYPSSVNRHYNKVHLIFIIISYSGLICSYDGLILVGVVSLDCSGRRSEGEERGLGDDLWSPAARVAGSGTEQGAALAHTEREAQEVECGRAEDLGNLRIESSNSFFNITST